MSRLRRAGTVVGTLVGWYVPILIGRPLWPDAPLTVAVGLCLAGALIGAALGSVVEAAA